MPNLIKKLGDKSRNKSLVFTSAGDYSNVHQWLGEDRDFDLFLCYYGDQSGKFSDISDYYFARKDGKFPNLHFAYQHWAAILDQYSAIFVLDDDIIISCEQINKLFEIQKSHDLWLMQPAFSSNGKVSHPITSASSSKLVRYTNFVEVTCPLFRKDKLDSFMAQYDPTLVGWGVDFWFIYSLGKQIEGKIAVIDGIPCINPHDETKPGGREIEKLQRKEERVRIWRAIQARHGIRKKPHMCFIGDYS